MRALRTLSVLVLLSSAGCGVADAPAANNATASSATARMSRGSDFDGDGLADFAVGAPAAQDKTGRVFVYAGVARGAASATLAGGLVIEGRFGTSVAALGDVNGDGFDDLAVGTEREARVYVYYGGAGGLNDARRTVIALPAGSETHFGHALAALGDVNGDGLADLAVSDAGTTPRVYLFAGGAGGIATSANAVLASPDGSASFGWSMAGADVDGDGLSDVLVSEPYVSFEQGYGEVFVFSGGAWEGLDAARPDVTLRNPDRDAYDFGYALANAGDVNGDGIADVLVGTYADPGRAYLYEGSANSLADRPAITLSPAAAPDAHAGMSVASAGDVNGDGYADVLVGSTGSALSIPGRVELYRGGPRGLSTTPDAVAMGAAGTGFGWFVAAVGDVDGDGRSDILAGAPFEKNSEGRAYVLAGESLAQRGVLAAPETRPSEFGRVATR